MKITQAGKGENNRKTVKTSLPVLTYDSSTTIEDKRTQYNRNIDRNRLQLKRKLIKTLFLT